MLRNTQPNRESMPRSLTRFSKTMVFSYLAALILMLIYTIYRSEVIFEGTNRPHYLLIGGVVMATVLFWLYMLTCSVAKQLTAVLIATGIVCSLYLVEVTVWALTHLTIFRFVVWSDEARLTEYRSREENPRALRRKEVMADLRAFGNHRVTPPVFPLQLISTNGLKNSVSGRRIFPLTGLPNRTIVSCQEDGIWSIWDSDRHGFNNPDWVWDKSPIDWLLIGDSFANGACVQRGNDLAARLRVLTSFTIANLGINGNGPLIELATLIEYASALRPKLVFWLYFEGNDLTDLSKESSSGMLNQYLAPNTSQDLIKRQPEINRVLHEFLRKRKPPYEQRRHEQAQSMPNEKKIQNYDESGIIRLWHIRSYLKQFPQLINEASTPNNIKYAELREVLKKANSIVSEWGGKLIFVYLPMKKRYEYRSYLRPALMQPSDVLQTVAALDIETVDLTSELFDLEKQPLKLFARGKRATHYNAVGYDKVARKLLDLVQ